MSCTGCKVFQYSFYVACYDNKIHDKTGLSCTLCTWLVQIRQCFWAAELLILPFSWVVPTELTGNTAVATTLCVQMKILQEERTAAPCFAKGKYVHNSTDPPETVQRGSFWPQDTCFIGHFWSSLKFLTLSSVLIKLSVDFFFFFSADSMTGAEFLRQAPLLQRYPWSTHSFRALYDHFQNHHFSVNRNTTGQ